MSNNTYIKRISLTQELVFARILQGLSIGMMMSLRSVLIGEYTSPRHRGALLTTVSLAQAFGIFFVHALGSLLSWQRTALVCVFFSFVSLLMTIHSPESPSWLATQGRYDECRRVFRWLRGDREDDELDEMIEARNILEKAKIDASTYRKSVADRLRDMTIVLQKKEFYKPIVLMLHAYFMVQFAGGTTMASYSTKIIGLLMGPGANVHFWMVALDTQRIFSNALAVYIIDKIKRRTMMFVTGGVCVVSHLAIAAYVYTRISGSLPYDAQWIPVLLINLQFLTVAMGMIPMPSVIAGEVFPLEYRSIGSSISVISLAVWLFIVLKTFPSLIESLGLHGTYALYAGVLTYNLVVMWYLLPETKDRTLQHIEDEFRGRSLVHDELEARQSLQDDLLLSYKRKVSIRRSSSPVLF